MGVIQCLIDWALDPNITQGFSILVKGGRPVLTGEAIVVRHSKKFTEQAVQSAESKLARHGVDISAL